MQNIDIRVAITESGLKHYQIAEKMGITDTSFSRLMRHQLTGEKKQHVLEAIEQLKREKANANN